MMAYLPGNMECSEDCMLLSLEDCGRSPTLSRSVLICGTFAEVVSLRGLGGTTRGLGGPDSAGELAV